MGKRTDFLRRLDWAWDYYFVYFLFNTGKIHRYHDYMWQKWGQKYCSQTEYDNYKNSQHDTSR